MRTYKKIGAVLLCLFFLGEINVLGYDKTFFDGRSIVVITTYYNKKDPVSKLLAPLAACNLNKLVPGAKVIFGSKVRRKLKEAGLDKTNTVYGKEPQKVSKYIKDVGTLLGVDYICFIGLFDYEHGTYFGVVPGGGLLLTPSLASSVKVALNICFTRTADGKILTEKTGKRTTVNLLSGIGLSFAAAPNYSDSVKSESFHLLRKIFKTIASNSK